MESLARHGAARRFALSCALLAASPACRPAATPVAKKPQAVQVGQVSAFELQQRDPASPNAMIGDFVLQGPALRVQVQGGGRAEWRGAIVGLTQDGTSHDWESLSPLLAIDGVLGEVRVQRISARKLGGRPALVIAGSAGAQGVIYRVERSVRLTDVGSAVRISTRAWRVQGPAPRELAVVERVAWGGGFPMAPLVGQLLADTPVQAEWVARGGDARAVVVAALNGPLRIVGRHADHGRLDQLRFTDVWLPVTRTGNELRAEALVSASTAGIAQAVRRVGWARGQPFAEVMAVLDVSPPGASVQLFDSGSGRAIVSGVPDDQRRVLLPLPAASLQRTLELRALAHGHAASDPVKITGPPYPLVKLAVSAASRLRVTAEHAATAEPLPVRIRVLPRKGTPTPDLGPDWKAAGAGDTVIASSGRADVGLPAGYYRVIVSHGPEWSVLDTQVVLDVGKTTEVHARLERAIDPGAWIACELHVHAAPSPDSQVALEDRVASLTAEGIAFAIPTDHNHVTDLGDAIRAQPLWGLGSLPGVEVTTDAPNYGHFNAFPFPADPDKPGRGAPEFQGVEPGELFDALHAIDPSMIVQVNHPRIEGGIGYFDATHYDPSSDQGDEHYSPEYDTLEVWNGFDLARRANIDRVFNEWLAMLAHGRRVVATGSSDSHTIRSEGAGYPRTYVRPFLGGMTDAHAVLHALKAGRAFVTSGPFLSVRAGGKGPGEELVVTDGKVTVEIRAQVPAWMQLDKLRVYVGDKLVRSGPIGAATVRSPIASRYERTLPLSLAALGALVVVVEGNHSLDPIIPRRGVPPLAFTNPIWLVSEPTPTPVPGLPPPTPEPSAGAGGGGGGAGGTAAAGASGAEAKPTAPAIDGATAVPAGRPSSLQPPPSP
jgi:hypothetical protein